MKGEIRLPEMDGYEIRPGVFIVGEPCLHTSGAFSMDDGFIDRSTNAFAVPRVGVDRTHTETEFGQVFLPSTIYFRRVVKAVLGFVRVLRLRIDQLKQSPLLDRDQKYKVS
jgi:hypothetical protein